MNLTRGVRWLAATALVVASCASVAQDTQAQVRGVYPVGMNATNSGATPAPGLTYSNLFVFYSRDELKDEAGETIATGGQSVLMDMNTLLWASHRTFLGGARFSAAATLPVANNSLTSDPVGAVSGGGGFADSFYQPAILGWQLHRADVRLAYGFLAPTGRFEGGEPDNVGSGYWTHTVSVGQTGYLTQDHATSLSAFQMYEFHGIQEDTDIHPGQTMNLDYSLTHTFLLQEDVRLQAGLVGYGQWQTTDKTGPGVTPEEEKAHYRVNSVGFAANVLLPSRKASLGLKYFQEFAIRSTVQGYTLHISGSTSF